MMSSAAFGSDLSRPMKLKAGGVHQLHVGAAEDAVLAGVADVPGELLAGDLDHEGVRGAGRRDLGPEAQGVER